jgi:hypothetical protein
MSDHIIYDAGDTRISVGYMRSTRARVVHVYENVNDEFGLKDHVLVLTASFEGDHPDVAKQMWHVVYEYGSVADVIKDSVEEYIINEIGKQVADDVVIDWTKGIPM